MAVNVRRADEEVSIIVRGLFTYSTHVDFRNALDELKDWMGDCLIDLSQVEYIDSSALGVMLLTLERFSNVRIEASEAVKRPIEIANLNRLFDIKYV